ncbi:hypothetical protein ABTH43_19880, partial [Acinetobacter baumannii]
GNDGFDRWPRLAKQSEGPCAKEAFPVLRDPVEKNQACENASLCRIGEARVPGDDGVGRGNREDGHACQDRAESKEA